MPPAPALDDAREDVARACRLLALRGLSEDVLGHVSMRVGDDRLLIRCRGPRERGLRFTEPDDVRVVDFEGNGHLEGGYQPPSELPIHVEVLRRRPDVGAVVHAHPPAVVTASLAGVALLPIFGAFDIPAMRLAEAGVPTFARSVLIRRADLAHEMMGAMAGSSVCVLRGHGVVTSGSTVASAMLRALAVDRLARMSLAVIAAGGTLSPIPEADRQELPDLGAAFNETVLWRHHLAVLAAEDEKEGR